MHRYFSKQIFKGISKIRKKLYDKYQIIYQISTPILTLGILIIDSKIQVPYFNELICEQNHLRLETTVI